MKFDIIIIGAGIAGTTLSHYLDPSIKTLILEKNKFPSHKPCGNIISQHGFDLLPSPPDYIFNSPKTMQLRMNSSIICSKFYNLRRMSYYKWIVSPNCSILDNTAILNISRSNNEFVVCTDRGEFGCDFLVGADGVLSKVRRSFYKKQNIINAIQFTYNGIEQSTFDMINDKSISNDYYAWFIPVDGNVLIGADVASKDKLIKYVNIHYSSSTIINTEYMPITKIQSIEEVITGDDRLLLVGEAAGMVQPTFGAGINFAISSAISAAKSINTGESYKKLCEPIIQSLSYELDSPGRF